MTYIKRTAIILFLFFGLVCPALSRADDAEGFLYRWIPVGLQVSTSVSDGVFTLEEIADAAQEAGLNALIVTDRDLMRWEYGLWPLRRLIKKTLEAPSIATYGVAKYLQEIEFLAKKYPGLILIPGAESAPFYYWSGSPFTRSLKIHDWHRHVLVVGLTDARDYKDLPQVARPQTIRRLLRWTDIFRLFPFALIVLGAFLFYRRECDYKDERGVACSRFALRWRLSGVVLISLGALFVINESPFLPLSYDQYDAHAGYRPYQRLIDFVRENGGLTFWAHPEASNTGERDGIGIETTPHPDAVLATIGYTGFCIFPEGYDVVGRPAGQWDKALLEFCREERKAPVWAVAGMSFDAGERRELLRRMKGTRTYVLADALNTHDILQALRLGMAYATAGGGEKPLLLHEYSLMDSGTGRRVGTAQGAVISGSCIIAVTADEEGAEEERMKRAQEGGVPQGERDAQAEAPKDIKVRVIRNGAVAKEEDQALPLRFIFIDPQPLTEMSYYRVVITRGPQIIATNPIFVLPKEKPAE